MTLTGSQPEVVEFFWIHVELVGILLNTLQNMWNCLKLLESFGNVSNLTWIILNLVQIIWNFRILEEKSSNGWEFLWIWKANFWTISNFVVFEENHWIISGNHLNILESIRKFWNHSKIFQFGQNWNGIKLYNCKFLESWSNSMEKCPRRQMIWKLRLWNDVHPGSY